MSPGRKLSFPGRFVVLHADLALSICIQIDDDDEDELL